MTVDMMQRVIALGDAKGLAMRELCEYYGVTDYNVADISDDMAVEWIGVKEDDTRDNNGNQSVEC